MTDYSSPALLFIAGILLASAIGWLLHRRLISGLQLSTSTNSNRLVELETQLARQSEEFSNQLSQRAREHMEELDRFARERRQVDESPC